MSTNTSAHRRQLKTTLRQSGLSAKEEAQMRMIILYCAVGLILLTEIFSLILYLSTRDIEVTFLPFLPYLLFYRILCYLFPVKQESNLILTLLQLLLRKRR